MKRILALLLVVSVLGAVAALARPPAQSALPMAPAAVRPQYVARPSVSLAPAPVLNRVFGPFAPLNRRVQNAFSLPYRGVICGPYLCIVVPPVFVFGLPLQAIGN